MIYKNFRYYCEAPCANWIDEKRSKAQGEPVVCVNCGNVYKSKSLMLDKTDCEIKKIANTVMNPDEDLDLNTITLQQVTNRIECLQHCLAEKMIITTLDNGVKNVVAKVINDDNKVSKTNIDKIISNRNMIKKIIDKLKDQSNEINLMKNTIDKMQDDMIKLKKSNTSQDLSESIDSSFFN